MSKLISYVISEFKKSLFIHRNYVGVLKENGLTISGTSPDKKLVETIEIKNHPFFIAVQFHPEFKSSPLNPHPLFKAFIEACKKG